MEKQISVIVPVYQGEETIERCLNSILQSTYKHLEVIVINDGSTDKSDEICKKVAQLDNRVYYITTKNQGVSLTRNRGLIEASGEYICFVDSDDYVDKNMYSIMIENMKDDIDMVICGCNHCYKNGDIKPNQEIEQSYENHNHDDAYFSMLYKHPSMAVWDKMYRSKCIKDNFMFFHTDITRYEDFVFNAEYIACCQAGIKKIYDKLYCYVQTENSLSRGCVVTYNELKNAMEYLRYTSYSLGEKGQIAFLCASNKMLCKLWYKKIIYNQGLDELNDIYNQVKKDSILYLKLNDVLIKDKVVFYLLLKFPTLVKYLLKLVRKFLR